MKSGTMWGIHAESSSQAVPLMKKYQAAGVQIASILAHENPGLCVDAKAINPAILTIARWTNPNPRWEGGQDVEHWPTAERADFAAKSIQLIFDRTNDTEYQASDYFCPGLNEWDPPGANGYKAMGEVLVLVCNEATRRSPEMTAKGLHPIRLAIPGFNSGTPEWNEMQAMVSTSLLDLMRARGDVLILHEGVWWDQPIDKGYGDMIPGAPSVPAGAGSLCGRFNYWYGLLGVEVPFVITEWYDGNRRETTPAKRLDAMKWYDNLVRHNPLCRGFCPFELTDNPNSPWWPVDFTPTFESAELLAYMVAEKDVPNPLGDNVDTTKIRQHARCIINIVDDVWWLRQPPVFKTAAPNKVLTFRHADGAPIIPNPRPNPITYQLDVFFVDEMLELLLVTDFGGGKVEWWVLAADVSAAIGL